VQAELEDFDMNYRFYQCHIDAITTRRGDEFNGRAEGFHMPIRVSRFMNGLSGSGSDGSFQVFGSWPAGTEG
jgi:hypothetical protein